MHEWQPGDKLFGANYEIVEVLGGSMGTVYVVNNLRYDEDHRPKVMTAKTLQKDYAALPELRKRFHEEAKLWVNLPPNESIVRAYYCDYFLGMPYVLAEYVQPGIFPNTLAEWIRQRLTPPPVALYVLSSIIGALEHAYRNNIRVHGDLKPSNILIDNVGGVKVSDWGLSRSTIDSPSRSKAISNRDNPDALLEDSLRNRGTPGYAAPEIVEQLVEPTAVADVYSVGVILGELLTRTRFTHGTSGEQIATMLEQSYPFSREEVTKLTDVLLLLLIHDPDERARHFNNCIEQLMQLLEAFTSLQRAPPKITIRPVDQSWLGQVMYSNVQLGQHDKALKAFKALYRVSNKSDGAVDARSAMILNIDDGTVITDSAAIEPFAREAEQHPNNLDKQLRLADQYAFQGNQASAKPVYLRVLDIDEDNDRALKGLVSIAESQKHHQEACVLSKRRAAIQPQTVEKWIDFARICAEIGDVSEALRACKRARRLGSLGTDALLVWGHSLMQAGKRRSGLRTFKRAVRSDPENGVAHYNVGVARRALGQRARSIRDFEKAIELDGPIGMCLNHIGSLQLESGDVKSALITFQRAAESSPDNAKIWFNMSQCLAATGSDREALRYIDVALSIDPNYELALAAKLQLEASYRD